MSPTPEHKMPTTAAGESGPAASFASAHGKSGSVPPLQVYSTAELVMSRLTALRLDTYAQALRALSPPTVVAPPARDEVSALTALSSAPMPRCCRMSALASPRPMNN